MSCQAYSSITAKQATGHESVSAEYSPERVDGIVDTFVVDIQMRDSSE